MHRIRPHLGLTLHILVGGTVGTGSILAWSHALAPYRISQWVLVAIAGTTALLVLRVLAEVQHRRTRPKRRRAHARPHPTKTNKETA
ncbi:hypothetical protein [Streptomyces pilosus]|uniref:hypothetical protein n=1 Tax=Streptomyces pilosus TaxID=28893 RepID=UPI0036454068